MNESNSTGKDPLDTGDMIAITTCTDSNFTMAYYQSPMREVDFTLAAVLLVCTVWGTLTNALSLWFFRGGHEARTSRNSSYFRQVYQAICVCDLVICATVLPVAVALLQEDGYPCYEDDDPLFGIGGFCYGWFLLWDTASKISVFLVAVLSTARFLLLIRPITQLDSRYNWLVIGGYSAFTLGWKALFVILVEDVGIQYIPETRYCTVKPFDTSVDFFYYEKFITSMAIVQIAAPMVVVMITFQGSLIMLWKSRMEQAGSNDMHKKAAVTVAIVTILHLIFNLPLFIVYWIWFKGCINSEELCTFSDVFSGRFLYYYTEDLFYVVFFTLNSAINPIIYYYRMDPFKKFVDASTDSVHTTMQTRMSTVIKPIGLLQRDTLQKDTFRVIVEQPSQCKEVNDTAVVDA